MVWININFHYHTCSFLICVFSSFLYSHLVCFPCPFVLGSHCGMNLLFSLITFFALKLIANIKKSLITQCMYNNNNNNYYYYYYYLLDSSSFDSLESCLVLWQDLFYEGGSCLWGKSSLVCDFSNDLVWYHPLTSSGKNWRRWWLGIKGMKLRNDLINISRKVCYTDYTVRQLMNIHDLLLLLLLLLLVWYYWLC